MARYNSYLESHGENVEIGCLRYQKATGEIGQIVYSHAECDGIGALSHGLRAFGYLDKEIPRFPVRRPPRFWRLWPRLARFLFDEFRPVSPIPWRTSNPRPPYRAYGKVFHVFCAQQTSDLLTRAAMAEGTYNAFLLRALNEAVSECLLERRHVNRWHIPIQMGGSRERGREMVNRLSNFVQEMAPDHSVAEVARQQNRHFRLGTHFATDFFLGIGDYYGFGNVLRGKVRKDYQRPRSSERIIGTFSSLGGWPKRGAMNRNPYEVILPFGNVSLKNPICACNIIWHGQLAVTLMVHSSVVSSDAEVRALLQCWMKKVTS